MTPSRSSSNQVEVSQEWAFGYGGIYDLVRVVEVLEGRYLRRPDVAIIPTEFCRVEWLTGRLKGQVTDQRAPYHRLGQAGGHTLYRRADGTLTPFGEREEKTKRLWAELRETERRALSLRRELDLVR